MLSLSRAGLLRLHRKELLLATLSLVFVFIGQHIDSNLVTYIIFYNYFHYFGEIQMAMVIKKFFAPIQKAQVDETDNSLMRFKKLPLITAIGGYHAIDIREDDSDIPLFLRCLMPNLEMLWDPRRAYETSQHLGIGSYLTNPLLALVLLVRVSIMNEEEEEEENNESARRTAQFRADRGGSPSYDVKHTNHTALKLQLFLLSIIVMLIDALKMIVTYALVLPALPIALPIMKYLDNKRSTVLAEDKASLEDAVSPKDAEADLSPDVNQDDEYDRTSNAQPG